VGLATLPRKKGPVTETTRGSHTGIRRQRRDGTSRGASTSKRPTPIQDTVPHDNAQGDLLMMRSSESLRKARSRNSRLFTAKQFSKVGTWNVRTLFQCGRMGQVHRQMNKYKLGILGLSEVGWTGQGRFTSEQVTILYSGREEHHYQGVGIMLNIEATKALVG